MKSLRSTKALFIYTSLALVSGALISYFALRNGAAAAPATQTNTTETDDRNDDNGYQLVTGKAVKGNDLVSPLLYGQTGAEARSMGNLKTGISNIIEDAKRLRMVSSASVYLVSLNEGNWICVNPDEPYHPGSLIKVPMLITYLKQAMTDPELLNRKLYYQKEAVPMQTYNAAQLQSGQSYTVRELLRYMIEFSDNNATNLLNRNANVNMFEQVFTDLNIPEPDVKDRNYAMTVKRYSEFLQVLYSATYLPPNLSQYALDMMTHSAFKDGMVKGLPADLKVAHKFGEWGDVKRNLHELHESGIVYAAGRPYLLTIMTKGDNPRELSEQIAKISLYVYETMAAQKRATLVNVVYDNTI